MVERGPRWSLVVVGGGDGDGDVGEEGNAAVLLQGTRRRSQSPRGRMPPLTCERRNYTYSICRNLRFDVGYDTRNDT